MTGTIKTLVRDRKFGFISVEGQPKDVFFHQDSLQGITYDELNVGDKVSFDIEQGQKGPAAKNVQREQ